MVSFFDFPAEHWKHLPTTNVIESAFATVRLRERVTNGAGSHQLAAEDAVHVGDSEHLDVAGASGAGMAAVLLNPKLSGHVSITGRVAQIASLAGTMEALRAFDTV